MAEEPSASDSIEQAIAYLLADAMRAGFLATSKALEVAMVAVRLDIETVRRPKPPQG